MNRNPKVMLAEARKSYHRQLIAVGVLSINDMGVPSNADKDSVMSVRIGLDIARALRAETRARLAAQRAGSEFEAANAAFLENTFPKLGHLRPGDWRVCKARKKTANDQDDDTGRIHISQFEQYSHLADLLAATRINPALKAALGNDYMIHPDVIIVRGLVSDDEINQSTLIVDKNVATGAAIRKTSGGRPILHASVSSKWTIRSDRSQNSRAEALNLIRNRKGHLPHIVVVTGEPLPSRLVSIALGTGDIDCVYHFALPELITAVKGSGEEEAMNMLDTMVLGKRLKDISDLPLDLAV